MVNEITVIIADDHPIFRRGLAEVLRPGYRILAEAADGVEALDFIERLKPSVAILDIDMPKMNGLEVMKEIGRRKLDVCVIVLTMYEEEKMFNKALDLGVRGYVLKENAVTDIRDGVKAVADGKYYISPSISGYLARRVKPGNQGPSGSLGLSDLSPSERRILRLISENKTSKDIAAELAISVNTVENHRSHICRKLGITGNNALLRFALEKKDLL